MHAPYDRSRKTGYRPGLKSSAGFLILLAVCALALIGLATFHPRASIWISQAVDAEFGGSGPAQGMPVETAQPGMLLRMQTVHAE